MKREHLTADDRNELVFGSLAEAITEQDLRRHLERVTGPRDPLEGRARMEAAADYIAEAFTRSGLAVTEDRFLFEGRWFRNVIASHGGSAPGGTVLICAHYDTVPGSPGADDNASGIAGLLEGARALARHRFRHDLGFAAFGLEEYGYPGSLHYVREAKARGTPILGVFDLEMIGYTGPTQAAPPWVKAPPIGDFICVVGNRRSAELVRLFTDGVTRWVPALPVEGLIVEGNGEAFPVVRRSDHAPFWDAGYRAAMITDTAFLRNPHYHLPTDTLETLDLDFLRGVAVATAIAAAGLAGPA